MQHLASMTEHASTRSLALVRFGDEGEHAYEVLRKDPDGTLELRPETPAAASLRRLGHVPVTIEELEAEYGPMLPPDDEP